MIKTIFTVPLLATHSQAVEAAARERRRMARRLHNELFQQMLGAAFSCKLLETNLAKCNSGLAGDAGELLHLVTDSVREARQIAHEISISELDGVPFVRALQTLNSARRGITYSSKIDNSIKPENLESYALITETVAVLIDDGGAKEVKIEISTKSGQLVIELSALEYEANTDTKHAKELLELRANSHAITLSISPIGENGCAFCFKLIIA